MNWKFDEASLTRDGVERWTARTANYSYSVKYSLTNRAYYVALSHSKKSICYNSLQIDGTLFDTADKAKDFCEQFKPENYNCVYFD